jgi:glyoxylase I family protein
MMGNFVHHICIQTNHYEESLKFYREVLGFELIEESPSLSGASRNSEGIVHFCVWVEDLVREVQSIKQLGYEFILKNGQVIYKVENGSLCKIVAPEGTIIELRDNKGI